MQRDQLASGRDQRVEQGAIRGQRHPREVALEEVGVAHAVGRRVQHRVNPGQRVLWRGRVANGFGQRLDEVGGEVGGFFGCGG
ncbi:MAG: hypothetical protein M9906_05985, partial [Microthrixaceae bacterium]|nr:hypothetical protein [Microthrixaceae bacterium]